MADIAVIISILSIAGIIVGLFSPKKSLFWYDGKKSRTNAIIIYGFILFLSFLLFAITN